MAPAESSAGLTNQPNGTNDASKATAASLQGEGTNPQTTAFEAQKNSAARILAITYELLLEGGIDNLRMQQVADRASVSLSTIYTNWANKTELTVAAISAYPFPEMVETEDPRKDLATLIELLTATTYSGESIVSFIVAAQDQPEIAAACDRYYIEPLRAALRHGIGRIIGVDHPSMDLLLDAFPGAALMRLAVRDQQIDGRELCSQILGLVDLL